MPEILLLNIDPNSSTLLAYILTGVSTIIGALFFVMMQAKNAQMKEKDNSTARIIAAKDETIKYAYKLLDESKKAEEGLQAEKMQLLAQVLPALKATQETMKEIAQAFREISQK